MGGRTDGLGWRLTVSGWRLLVQTPSVANIDKTQREEEGTGRRMLRAFFTQVVESSYSSTSVGQGHATPRLVTSLSYIRASHTLTPDRERTDGLTQNSPTGPSSF